MFGGTKIEAWRALGQVWERLGPSWAILDVFGSVLDRLGSVLAASWAALGRKRVPPKQSPNLQKIDLKIDQLFDATWNQKPSHVGSKMHSKFYLNKP